jgi:hypothetical protein
VIIGSKLMQIVGDEGVEVAKEWLIGVREALAGVSRSGAGARH